MWGENDTGGILRGQFLGVNIRETDFYMFFNHVALHACIKITNRKIFVFFLNYKTLYYGYEEESSK